jgi:diguanylate cyclase (GGDEF)-like protein/PAS domain S-box-containing protein
MALGVAALIHTTTGTSYWSNWLHWTLAHGLGTVTFTPIFTLLLGGEIGKWVETTTPRHRLGAAGMVTLMVGITIGVFSQSTVPLLFLPMVPMMVAAVSYEFIGAAASTAILAGVGGYLTVRGSGPIQLLHSPTGAQILFLQFYIASCALIALPIAAELRGRRRLFVSLRESEERFRLLAERSIDVVLNLDPDSIIRYVSPSITELTGLMPEDLIGTPASALAPPEDRTSVADAFEGIMALAGRPHSIELCVRTASGADRWCQAYSRAILDEAQRPIGVVCTLRDISEHKRLEQALAAAAHTDMLTGLPNRRAFALALEQFAAAARDGGPPAWLALIDLDNFKSVNDRWGHEAGDRVLRHFADIARATIRPEDVIARFGGEEFALILRGVDGDAMELICERLRIRVMNAVVYAKNGESIRFTMSAGIAIIDDRGADEILRAADQALYDAKHAGRNRLVLAA